jgi:hypothetical protein
MGNISITQALLRENVNKSKDGEWEQECYQEGCIVAQQKAVKRLKEIDERLFQNHPLSWKGHGFKERTIATRFGELIISRRIYRDEKGGYHYLLDDYLGWSPHQVATPSLQETLVQLATQVPFRQVSKTLEKLTGSVLSTSTVYRLFQKTAQAATEKERQDWKTLFGRGESPLGIEKKVLILYAESDGVWIHLQREKQQHYEIKNAIAYEGWKRLPGKEERYALVNKRVYCQVNNIIFRRND